MLPVLAVNILLQYLSQRTPWQHWTADVPLGVCIAPIENRWFSGQRYRPCQKDFLITNVVVAVLWCCITIEVICITLLLYQGLGLALPEEYSSGRVVWFPSCYCEAIFFALQLVCFVHRLSLVWRWWRTKCSRDLCTLTSVAGGSRRQCQLLTVPLCNCTWMSRLLLSVWELLSVLLSAMKPINQFFV